jgi:single-strand DNA-binding protein
MSGKATIEIIGRLAKDPETRYTADGKAVCTLSIPVQERKDSDTVWYKVTAWEKQAETLNQYATKGLWIAVRGVPKIETWEDKNSGETRYQFAVTLREFTFCGGASATENASDDETPAAKPTPARAPVTTQRNPTRPTAPVRNAPKPIETEDDIPF